MRVLVCGGRDYTDERRVFSALQALQEQYGPFTHVIEGGASGADRLGFRWAHSNGISTLTFRANWKAHGRAAGPIRNQKMLDDGKPGLVVAFPGGKGTEDMVSRAGNAGVRVVRVG
ncbi:MAG: DUF2493 domain-containing protein [Hyphomicrobiales bacterium]|nr:MAG: DUF2493 domain-containing protein [Hyphomicrobiales bacterium]